MLKRIPVLKRLKPMAQTQPAPASTRRKAPTTTERIVDMLGVPGVLGLKLSRDFMELRAWWPLLIPLMIWEARRTYQRERERSLRLRQERLFGKK